MSATGEPRSELDQVEELPPQHRISWWTVLAIALTTVAAVAPLLSRGPSCGHDFDFHLLSWMEVARDWSEGLVWPQWIASANYGAGEPRLVFYPPASWLLGAALRVLVGLAAAPAAFTGVSLLVGGFTMYRLARAWLSESAAGAAACLYIANPYTLFVAYERTAYGELLGSAFLPLLLLYALRRRPPVARMGIVFAAIWLSNAPAGVIAGYTIALLGLIRLFIEHRAEPPLRIAGGAALGLGLAAFYLVPATYEQRWVEIRRAINPGMRIEDSFLFAHTGEAFHDAVLHTASILAVLLLGVWLAGALLWWRAQACDALASERTGRAADMARRSLTALAALPPLILFLLLPASDVVWRHAPELAFLQFSWRWLMLLSVLTALFLAGALRVQRFGMQWRWVSFAMVGVLVIASIAISTRHFYQPCDEDDAVPAEYKVFLEGTGVEGTDEYTPRGADNSAIQQGLPLARLLNAPDAESAGSSADTDRGNAGGVNPPWSADVLAELAPSDAASIEVRQWTPERKRVTVHSARSGFLVLTLMDYPAWRVHTHGTLIRTSLNRSDGLLVLPLAAGVSTVEVEWSVTPDVWVGRGVSLLALGVLGGLFLTGRKRVRA